MINKIGIFIFAIILIGLGYFFFNPFEKKSPARDILSNMNDISRVDPNQTQLGHRHRLVPDLTHPQTTSMTVPVDEWQGRQGYWFTGMSDGGFGHTLPVELTNPMKKKELLNLGIIKYNANCSVCHGKTGDGRGAMSKYSEYPTISSFWSEKYRDYPLGKMFNSIAKGQGNMPAFGSKLSPKDIWSIILHIQQLQQDQHK